MKKLVTILNFLLAQQFKLIILGLIFCIPLWIFFKSLNLTWSLGQEYLDYRHLNQSPALVLTIDDLSKQKLDLPAHVRLIGQAPQELVLQGGLTREYVYQHTLKHSYIGYHFFGLVGSEWQAGSPAPVIVVGSPESTSKITSAEGILFEPKKALAEGRDLSKFKDLIDALNRNHADKRYMFNDQTTLFLEASASPFFIGKAVAMLLVTLVVGGLIGFLGSFAARAIWS